MRVFIGAALAAFLVAAPAAAQTDASARLPTRCDAMPAAPEVPDGASANQQAMTAAQERITAWSTAANAVIACRNAEMDAWKAQYDATGAAYRAEAETAAALLTNWSAEINEFNERNANPRRRLR
jgi:hypothetical protein